MVFVVVGGAALIVCLGNSQSVAATTTHPAAWQFPEFRILFGSLEPPIVFWLYSLGQAPSSNQQSELRPLECSGLAWGGQRLLVSSDRHGHVLFSTVVDLNRAEISLPQPAIVIPNEELILDDAECLTVKKDANGNQFAYAMCSLSNDRGELPLPGRRHFLRCRLKPDGEPEARGASILNMGSVREQIHKEFEILGVPLYRAFYPDFSGANKNTYRWGNVEGIAFAPNSNFLLCGMRNPLVAGRAPVFAIEGVDLAFDTGDINQMKLADLFCLDLGGRGISDLCWDPVTKGYLITAARSNGPKIDKDQPYPPNQLDSALFWWSGRKTEIPLLFAKAPDMTVEAICRLGDSPFIVIGTDERDESEGREHYQSVLAIMSFTGPAIGSK